MYTVAVYNVLFAYGLSMTRNSLVMLIFLYGFYFVCYDVMMMLLQAFSVTKRS